MTRRRRKTITYFVILALACGTLAQPRPGWAGATEQAAPAAGPGALQVAVGAVREPGAAGMIIDGLVVRPLGLVATLIGSVVFVVTLPFSALGGNVDQARENLVDAPVGYTFTRCLGCFGGPD
jgi:hypothetical protein